MAPTGSGKSTEGEAAPSGEGMTTLASGTFFIPAAPEPPREKESGGESLDVRRYLDAIRKRALWIVASIFRGLRTIPGSATKRSTSGAP